MTEMLRQLILSILDDDYGISAESYEVLINYLQCCGETELLGEIASLARATDNRFYIK
jgi:hypothetical protein